MTKKDVYLSSSIQSLKDMLATAPVLSFPCFGPDQEFILETDASGVGLGAVRIKMDKFIQLPMHHGDWMTMKRIMGLQSWRLWD